MPDISIDDTSPIPAATGMDALQTVLLWSPFVIGLRMPVLARESLMFDQGDRTETNRLVDEKVGAFWESAVAVQCAAVTAMMGFAVEASRFSFDASLLAKAGEAMLKASVDPAATRVRDNAERLLLSVC